MSVDTAHAPHTYNLSIARLKAGRRTLVTGFECELPGAGLVCIVGPNGAGKSLLIRALTGIDRRQHVSMRRSNGTKPEIAVAFDFAGLLPSHGLSELLTSAAWFGCDRESVAANLARLGIDADNPQPFAQWSLGSRQRARIAVALSSDRPVVVLDEPFRSIDHGHRFALVELLVERSRSQLILVSTHHAELLNGFAHATMALRQGDDPITFHPAATARRGSHRVQVTGRHVTRFDDAQSIESDDGVVHQSAVLDQQALIQLSADLVAPDTEIYSVVIADLDDST